LASTRIPGKLCVHFPKNDRQFLKADRLCFNDKFQITRLAKCLCPRDLSDAL
jgi:hypothetical protein